LPDRTRRLISALAMTQVRKGKRNPVAIKSCAAPESPEVDRGGDCALLDQEKPAMPPRQPHGTHPYRESKP
jgi:hypothetical protein